MNNPYDPRTGMTRGYSTPFFMDALRHQIQVPASLGQRKVNYFFGDYSSVLPLLQEPTGYYKSWLDEINKRTNKWRDYSDNIAIPPSADFQSNMPILKYKSMSGLYSTDPEIEGLTKELQGKSNQRQPSRLDYIPDAEAIINRNYIRNRKQRNVEL